ncbi:hypothetical protein [Sphingobium yanoikuyae]|uniref:hypothetical protein n=1 Tax=Sphingobium yanoikuyae TaxID=13690 RepID=UPI0026F1710D|nr:hypothetical protein [Sphingobium yanoikuyae]
MLLHEDYPHTVPTRAWLRWKENYFWVFMDPDRDLCCLAHCTAEPTYDRAFASFTVLHKGQTIVSGQEVAMPSPFEHQKQLHYGGLILDFLKPQTEFRVAFEDDNLSAVLHFTRRMHLFDFQACADVNPDWFSISENTAFERNSFRHQGQCMNATGQIAFKAGDWAGTSIAVDGSGYRDHSWGMRNDQMTLDHVWAFFNFPSMGFHLMQVRNVIRPENRTAEGYIARPEGNEVMKALTIEHVGDGAQGMPETVIFRATTLGGERFTLVADVGNSFARLPLHSQKPGAKVYLNVENMCRVRCEETGEEGLANVEIGALMDA